MRCLKEKVWNQYQQRFLHFVEFCGDLNLEDPSKTISSQTSDNIKKNIVQKYEVVNTSWSNAQRKRNGIRAYYQLMLNCNGWDEKKALKILQTLLY
jgi:hypothetical protein